MYNVSRETLCGGIIVRTLKAIGDEQKAQICSWGAILIDYWS
jgi:hypothetical protein